MNNIMQIEGHKAIISYDPDLNQFRGEFTGLNGGADFYAGSVKALKAEGTQSLHAFLATCKERGIEPYKNFSGKFVVRVPAGLHARITEAANASGVSLNQWVQNALEHEIHP
jgi:predicted HicB family RNase H-like nuclease